MKAAILHRFGTPLSIETVADPVLGTGEVVVDVVAAPVLSYTDEVISDARRYPLELPIVLGVGGVGCVREVGPDATTLAAGDWVYCDPTVRARDDALDPDITLQGWSSRGAGGLKLARHFHDGAFAERVRIPTENAVRIGAIARDDAAAWCALGTCLVPYGGWLAAGLQPGETVVVSGATGRFGAAAVAVAIAMGVARVVAPGRNVDALDDLVRRFGDRIRPVRLTGQEDEDRKAMQAAAEGPIDVVLDILPPSVETSVVRTAITTVRRGGRIVLMGGVGMLGGPDLALPYPWIMRNDITITGKWMCPRTAVPRLAALVRAGLLRLDAFEVTRFPLDAVNDAVTHAAAQGGPFRMTVVEP